MPHLEEASVEFARRHVQRFYDTDFFPKHFGFEAIWSNWDEVSRILASTDPDALPLTSPRTIPWPKARGGYRMVHQLDPLSTLTYAALIHHVAGAIEAARAPIDAAVACSYRIALADGSFFHSGTGYSTFRSRSEVLCRSHTHVLATDITDFYNQIYVHRIRNAISMADVRLENVSIDIEKLLMRWNSRTSQGIPVGPAPSILVSEAVLIDVDRFITGKGFSHTRYVDDFRIFGDTVAGLKELLRDLTTYLYEAHRLNLSGEKTSLSTTAEFLTLELDNPYEVEKIDILESIEQVVNPYTQEVEAEIENVEGRDDAVAALTQLLDRVLGRAQLDVGMARAILRKARGLSVEELVLTVLNNVEQFLPVINDVALYIDHVQSSDVSSDCLNAIERVLQQDVAQEPAFRVWGEWLFTRSPEYITRPAIRDYARAGKMLLPQARIAVIETDAAWVRDNRSRYWELPTNDRLAVLFATPILSRDEREPWLRSIRKEASGATSMERWMANAALQGALDHSFAEGELPF